MKELKSQKSAEFRGGTKRYQAGATGKDKVIYDRIVELFLSGMSVMDIYRETDVARNTIYRIQRELSQKLS